MITSNKIDNKIKQLLLSLVFLQIVDGVLTCIGISLFGIEAEGNPLIQLLLQVLQVFQIFNPDLALLLVKGIVILILLLLYLNYKKLSDESKKIFMYSVILCMPWLLLVGYIF